MDERAPDAPERHDGKADGNAIGGKVTDPDLLLARRAARDDARAWEEIVARFGERIYNTARRFAGNDAEAEELTQDVFLKLYLNLGRYRGDVPFVGWALRLSKNACIDHWRRHRRRLQSEVSEEPIHYMASGNDPHRETWLAQRRRLVHRTLAEMGETQSTVLALCDLQGHTYEEAAAFLDVAVGTVKSRLHRARKDLFQRLEGHLESQQTDDDATTESELREGAR